MNRISLVVVAVLATLAIAMAQARGQNMDRNSKVEQQLIRMERELAEAATRGDVAMLERFTADDFIGIDHYGRELTKARILARFRSPDYEVESLRHEGIRVRVFGDCAVATARTVVKGRYKGQDVGGEFPYMRVWIRRQGRWQAVAAQSASIPQPQPQTHSVRR